MMIRRTKSLPSRLVRDEKGQLLILVLIFLLLGSLIIAPLLAYMGAGVKTGQVVFQKKTDELYAADAGIEDGIWQIKGDLLDTLFPDYSPYDYTNETWSYNLSEQVNAKNTNVTISNVWIPQDVDIGGYSEDDLRAIIENGKLIVTGSVSGTSTYQIKITYKKGGGDDALGVQTLGVWLPPGFNYVDHSSNLEVQGKPYYSVPVLSPHAGGKAVIWTFNSYPFAGDESHDPFPGVNPADNPMISTIAFQFTSQQPGGIPAAVSWITTSGVSDIPFSWDAGTTIYHINSAAGSTRVDTYIAKNALPKLQAAMPGDYYATGKTNMKGVDPNANQRELLLTHSDSNISFLPTANTSVELAYLYWSGWLKQPLAGSNPSVGAFWDNGNNLTFSDSNCKWTSGSPSSWSVYGTSDFDSQFRGHYSSGGENARYLTMKSNVDLTGVSSATIRWEQAAMADSPSDCLYFDLSNNGFITWNRTLAFAGGNPTTPYTYPIPSAYWNSQFKMRFYMGGFDGTSEYVSLDSICIMVDSPAITAKPADTAVTFVINGQPQIVKADPDNSEEVQSATVLSNGTGTPDGYYYACRTDVTELVKDYSNGANTGANPPVYGNGNGSYTVADIYADCKRADGGTGAYPWDGTYGTSSYAGWSLVIIYSSPDTKGHQLYLYDLKDTFRSVPSNEIDSPPIQISGFIVPQRIGSETDVAKLTVFVGEGDVGITGDYIALVDQHDATEHVLWDGVTCSNNSQGNPKNVWNGYSTDYFTAAEAGIDIDTFHILWTDNELLAGDTSAQIRLHTNGDGYVTIFMIISFRSSTTIGGSISYLIRG